MPNDTPADLSAHTGERAAPAVGDGLGPVEGADENVLPTQVHHAPAGSSIPDGTAGSLVFLKQFLRHPVQVGAVAPSSPPLVRQMVEWIDWGSARSVVEYGPGTGVFTEAIRSRLHPEGRFFAIEQAPDLATLTRARCPGTQVYEASAADVGRLCDIEGIDSIDAILCGLPWAAFPESLQRQIMEATVQRLRPGGQFATFAYWQGVVLPAGRRFSRRLRHTFSSVHRSPTAWRNLPPAFVYRCRK